MLALVAASMYVLVFQTPDATHYLTTTNLPTPFLIQSIR